MNMNNSWKHSGELRRGFASLLTTQHSTAQPTNEPTNEVRRWPSLAQFLARSEFTLFMDRPHALHA